MKMKKMKIRKKNSEKNDTLNLNIELNGENYMRTVERYYLKR